MLADPGPATSVERLAEEFESVISALGRLGEVSLQLVVEDHARKSLLLAAASFFEHRVCSHLEEFAAEGSSPRLQAFVKNKAIARQYHTMFAWDRRNANGFFGLFGEEWKDAMKRLVAEDRGLELSIAAFLEVGDARNRLVHGDYASFGLEKTREEVLGLYRRALRFVDELPRLLRDGCDRYRQVD